MLKVNEYGGRQAKVNEKRQCFKGWETLVRLILCVELLSNINLKTTAIRSSRICLSIVLILKWIYGKVLAGAVVDLYLIN